MINPIKNIFPYLISLFFLFPIPVLLISYFNYYTIIENFNFLKGGFNFKFYANDILIFINEFILSFLKSFNLAFISSIIIVLLATSAAYSLSKLLPSIAMLMLIILLIIHSIPPIIFLPSLFLMFREYNLINSEIGIIFYYTAMLIPISIIIFFYVFKNNDKSIEEAALLDGCDYISLFIKIILPANKKYILLIFFILFFISLNEFKVSNLLFDAVGVKKHTILALDIHKPKIFLYAIIAFFPAGLISLIFFKCFKYHEYQF